jgi:hypothetical protein
VKLHDCLTVTGTIVLKRPEKDGDSPRDRDGLPLPEFVDATNATINLTVEEVRGVVERVRDLGRHNALGPTAVLVGNDVSFGIVRMGEALVGDVADVRPFRDRAAAEEWLGAVRRPRSPSA